MFIASISKEALFGIPIPWMYVKCGAVRGCSSVHRRTNAIRYWNSRTNKRSRRTISQIVVRIDWSSFETSAGVTGMKSESNSLQCGWSKSKGEELPSNFIEIDSLRATIFWWKKEAREFASGCDMEGESCSLGGDDRRRGLMVDQRRLGFLEASLMDSIFDAARDLFISLFADEHAAR